MHPPDDFRHLPWFRATGSRQQQAPPMGFTAASNGIVSSMLTPTDRAALRAMNVNLTREAIAQCEASIGVRNQIESGRPPSRVRVCRQVPPASSPMNNIFGRLSAPPNGSTLSRVNRTR
jgi:hypothetical protein